LSSIIKITKQVDFGNLYIKPAFVFIDDYGHIRLQFEADADSALGYLYTNLCKMMGIPWNNAFPSNTIETYTHCSMHAANDNGNMGCGPGNKNTGGFCPQMVIAYSVRFQSDDLAAEYLAVCNTYVDYWRRIYPSGVAVGTSSFCKDGGCLGLFLNRFDLYQVFKPDLAGSWVSYNGGTLTPTISPAPTWKGGCHNKKNLVLDRCYKITHKQHNSGWETLGPFGQFSILLTTFMTSTLFMSVFLTRARKKKKKGESLLKFFVRDLKKSLKRKKKSKSKGKSKSVAKSSKKDSKKDALIDKSTAKSVKKKKDKSSSSKDGGRSKKSNDNRDSSRSKSRSKSTKSAPYPEKISKRGRSLGSKSRNHSRGGNYEHLGEGKGGGMGDRRSSSKGIGDRRSSSKSRRRVV